LEVIETKAAAAHRSGLCHVARRGTKAVREGGGWVVMMAGSPGPRTEAGSPGDGWVRFRENSWRSDASN
jgi:hypothetical protein